MTILYVVLIVLCLKGAYVLGLRDGQVIATSILLDLDTDL